MTDLTDSHPGPALKTAREKLGVSANDVAESLNLGIKVVVDIESCNYDNLPVAAFTRGYIRAYAKLLELDADVFVSQYDSVTGGAEVPPLVVSDSG
ncbi:MAG: helix-turn-helix transcriptional regulator, partial [Gammaproteobacteria bacterium]|nr:helix-turn-helix transcriptional regulator [Gammaproteobacteria bacterium]